MPRTQIQFLDHCAPPLAAGHYQAELSQVIDLATEQVTYTDTRHFRVTGPRFRLDPGDISAVHPGNGSTQDCSQELPHIVLTQPTLPWQRTVDGRPLSPGEPPTPWLALLLLLPDEIVPPAGDQPRDTLSWTCRWQDLLSPPDDILGPQLPDREQLLQAAAGKEKDNSTCAVVEVWAQKFLQVAPRLDELPYLAHGRQVARDSGDERCAVLIANRLPTENQRHVVHLVSLEGLADCLPGGKKAAELSGKQKVRLVSLYSWSFTCTKGAGQRLETLLNNVEPGLLRLPDQAISDPDIKAALENGYIPMRQYVREENKQSFAWYRGPLVPVNVPHEHTPFFSADEARIYDPDSGIFDLSAAAAWQTGRLLALADKTYAVQLLRWRRDCHGLLARMQQRPTLRRRLKLPDQPGENAQFRHNQVQGEAVRCLLTAIRREIAPAPLPAGTSAPLGTPRDPTGLHGRQSELPGLLTAAEVKRSLADQIQPRRALQDKLTGSGQQ